jgi:hypothetical protein
MTQMTFTVVPTDDSVDILISLEEWLRNDGLGGRIKRVATKPAVPGVGHQGGALDAIEAFLDTHGVGILIRSVVALAKSAIGRGRQSRKYVLECGDVKFELHGDLTDVQVSEIIHMASNLFDRRAQAKAGKR